MIVWFTGLGASGKTTTLGKLRKLLPEYMVLDGNPGYRVPSSDSKPIAIAHAAAELAKEGHGVLCASLSPYREERDEVRALIGDGFLEVYVNTPLALCKARDKVDRYKLLPPTEYEYGNPELVLCTVCHTAEENARIVYERIQHGK